MDKTILSQHTINRIKHWASFDTMPVELRLRAILDELGILEEVKLPHNQGESFYRVLLNLFHK